MKKVFCLLLIFFLCLNSVYASMNDEYFLDSVEEAKRDQIDPEMEEFEFQGSEYFDIVNNKEVSEKSSPYFSDISDEKIKEIKYAVSLLDRSIIGGNKIEGEVQNPENISELFQTYMFDALMFEIMQSKWGNFGEMIDLLDSGKGSYYYDDAQMLNKLVIPGDIVKEKFKNFFNVSLSPLNVDYGDGYLVSYDGNNAVVTAPEYFLEDTLIYYGTVLRNIEYDKNIATVSAYSFQRGGFNAEITVKQAILEKKDSNVYPVYISSNAMNIDMASTIVPPDSNFVEDTNIEESESNDEEIHDKEDNTKTDDTVSNEEKSDDKQSTSQTTGNRNDLILIIIGVVIIILLATLLYVTIRKNSDTKDIK